MLKYLSTDMYNFLGYLCIWHPFNSKSNRIMLIYVWMHIKFQVKIQLLLDTFP